MPSADHYAAALCAAARHTGEDALSFVDENPKAKFRHYALHALLHVFPGADRTAVSAALMAPGKSTYFYRTSIWHVLGEGPHRKGPIEWWDSGVLALTIKAVEKVSRPNPPHPALTAPLAKPVLRQPTREVEPRKAAVHGAPRTGLDRFADPFGRPDAWRAGGDDQLQGREREKRVCRDLLAEAAANTAKLQAKLPPEPDE